MMSMRRWPSAIGEGAGQRRRERRRVRQEAEKQTGRERDAAEIEDVERRGRQKLKRGQENREGEPAHHEEARGEQDHPSQASSPAIVPEACEERRSFSFA